jgi:MFS family permease
MQRHKHPLLPILITIFIDLLGFGMFISDIQLRGREFGASDLMLGLMISSFSFFQFLFAPFLGRLSDRVGRKPILVTTVLLSITCFLLYAHAQSLLWMFLSRSLAGIASANMSVAYAYVADITTPQNRAKGLGLIGAAYAMGFILGAPMGALLIEWGGGKPLLLGYTAAVMGFFNLLYVLFGISETLHSQRTKQANPPHGSPYKVLFTALQMPRVSFLLLLYFAATFAFANLESTFFQLNTYHFHLSPSIGALLLAYVGIVFAATQGGFLRKAVPIFGETTLLRMGFLMQAPALILLPFSPHWALLLVVMTVLSAGRSLSDPCLNSLISQATPKEMQGQIFGLTQSMGALARMMSPTVANLLLGKAFWMPYLCAGLLMLLPLIGSLRLQLLYTDSPLSYQE